MITNMKDIERLWWEIRMSAEKEAYRLWRLARKAENHGCKKTAEEMRQEARELHTTMTAYPERIIADSFKYKFKYAFR